MHRNTYYCGPAVGCDDRGAEPGSVGALAESDGRAGGVYPRAGAGDAIGSPTIGPVRRGCDGACDAGEPVARPGGWGRMVIVF